jgi:hypothetical protein
MKYIRIFVLVLVIVNGLLSACRSNPSLTPTDQTVPYPPPEQPATGSPYPSPEDSSVITPQEPYPAPMVTDEVFNPYPAPDEGAGYAPVSGDEAKDRGEVFLDLPSSDLLLMESYPIQAVLILRGDLPTSCHEFRAVVSEPDPDKRILVEAYSVVAKDVICTQALLPFEVRISLGNFTDGKYSVWINGQVFTDFEP